MEERMGERRIHKWFYRKMIEYLWDEQVKSELTGSEMGSLRPPYPPTSRTECMAAVQHPKPDYERGVSDGDETVNSLVYPTVFTIILTALLCSFRWAHFGWRAAVAEETSRNAGGF